MLPDTKQIIGKPEVVRSKPVAKFEHFRRNAVWRSDVEGVAVDWLCTPVAFVRAASTGDEIQRKEAVRLFPYCFVSFDLGQVPRGERKQIQTFHEGSRRGMDD